MAQLIHYQASLALGSKPVKMSAHLKMWTDVGWVAECHDTYLSTSSTLSTVSSFFEIP